MAKRNRTLTRAQKRPRKAAKKERQRKFETVFLNGKQVRIRRPPTVDGMPVNQFIEANADPVWLHQNGLWEMLPVEASPSTTAPSAQPDDADDDIPF